MVVRIKGAARLFASQTTLLVTEPGFQGRFTVELGGAFQTALFTRDHSGRVQSASCSAGADLSRSRVASYLCLMSLSVPASRSKDNGLTFMNGAVLAEANACERNASDRFESCTAAALERHISVTKASYGCSTAAKSRLTTARRCITPLLLNICERSASLSIDTTPSGSGRALEFRSCHADASKNMGMQIAE